MPLKTLQYVYKPYKKHTSIRVYRKKLKIDKNGKVKYPSEPVGSFHLYEHPLDLSQLDKKLTPAEQIELREFIYSAEFAKMQFNEDALYLGRDILRLPKGLLAAASELAVLAAHNGITFNPHQVMIDALFDSLKTLEQCLSEKTGRYVKVLEQHQTKNDR